VSCAPETHFASNSVYLLQKQQGKKRPYFQNFSLQQCPRHQMTLKWIHEVLKMTLRVLILYSKLLE